MSENTTEETYEPTRKAIVVAAPRRLVYLAGPVEIEDTWRKRAHIALAKMGMEGLDPMRGEEIKTVGKHLETNVPDSLLVTRDLNDLYRTKLSGGFCLMNLSTTKEGRKPIGTLFELQWCFDNNIAVIAVMGRDCDPSYRHHPWINVMVSAQVSSVTAGLKLIEQYFV